MDDRFFGPPLCPGDAPEWATFQDRLSELDQCVGYLSPRESATLFDLARTAPGDGAVVEVGAFLGRSSAYLAEGLKRRGGDEKVHSVDRFDLDTSAWGSLTPRGGFEPEWLTSGLSHFEIFEKGLQRAGLRDRVEAIPRASEAAAAAWNGGPVRLLFIDAMHTFAALSADLRAWVPHLGETAIVCFHDVAAIDHWDGVTRVIESLVLTDARFRFLGLFDSLAVFAWDASAIWQEGEPVPAYDPETFFLPPFPPHYWRRAARAEAPQNALNLLNGWTAFDGAWMEPLADGVVVNGPPGLRARIDRPIDTLIGETYTLSVSVTAGDPFHAALVQVFPGGYRGPGFTETDGNDPLYTRARTPDALASGGRVGSGPLEVRFTAVTRRSWIVVRLETGDADQFSILSGMTLTRQR
ncbi:class I SAM-dependent methyltransferase [Oleispirillum naphthae]|uniref:class I SAM-dependent methyltransferase n=1 Tax=Oleispirillum naphthae TaxID=2838853 RepID=UPI003082332C